VSPARDEEDREAREAPHESGGVEDVGASHEPRHGDGERGDAEEKRGRRRRRGRRGGRNREGREGRERIVPAGDEREHGGRQPSPDAHPAGDWNGHTGETGEASPHEPATDAPRDTHRDEPYVAAVDTGAQSHREVDEQRANDGDAPPHTPEPAHATDAERFAQSEPVRTPPPVDSDEPAQPARKGWWQKRFGNP
jgi:ribonuclease E